MNPLAAAALSAALYAAALPPWSADLLAPVALVPLLLALRARRLPAALGIGLAFALLLALATVWWLPATLVRFFSMSTAGAVLGAFAVSLLTAGVPFALFAIGAARLLAAPRWTAYAGVPALWVAAELMRARAFTGLPWELLGHALYRRLAVIQIAEVTGVYGLSFLCVATALATADAIRPRGGAGRRTGLVALAGVGLVWAGVAVYGSWRLDAVAAPAASMPVELVQANRAPARQPSLLRRTETFDAYLRLTRARPAAERPALIVWPENTASFFLERDAAPRSALEGLASGTDGVVLVGGPREDDTTGALHNSAYGVGAGGVVGRYDKMKLVPFAEYAPLDLRGLSAPDATFAPGAAPTLVPHPRGALGVLICYEILHPALARDLVRAGARVLVNISNDAWEAPTAALQTFSMAVFRAVETRRWVVRAATTGISGAIAPTGAVRATLPSGAAGVLPVDVAPLDALTPYVRVGDLFAWTCALAALATLLASRAARVAA